MRDTDPSAVQLEDRFALIPEALLYDPAVSANAVRVYGVLRRHGDSPDRCYPAHDRIARLVGASKRTVPSWIRELEDAGWVERIPRWRRGDQVVTTVPEDDDAGWESTSNGYLIRTRPRPRRAQERGVRAQERGGVRAQERGGYAPRSAPKESNGNESKRERTTAATPQTALSLLPDLDPDPPPVVRADARAREPSRGHAAKGGGGTADEVGRVAQALARLAYEQPVKPMTRGGFVAVRARLADAIEAGHDPRALAEAIEAGAVGVWTLDGISTALARRRGRGDAVLDLPGQPEMSEILDRARPRTRGAIDTTGGER